MVAKRALIIGCNYPNSKAELKGCVNDAKNMRDLLIEAKGFREEDVVLMIDTDDSYPQPTGANIRNEFKKLAQQARSGDVIFVHFSGHGTEVPPETGEQDDDGMDQCICPTDMNLITDDDFRDFVNLLPKDCNFTLISDSCHSGGLIDETKEQIGPKTAPVQSSGGGGGPSLQDLMGSIGGGGGGKRDIDIGAYGGGRGGYGGEDSGYGNSGGYRGEEGGYGGGRAEYGQQEGSYGSGGYNREEGGYGGGAYGREEGGYGQSYGRRDEDEGRGGGYGESGYGGRDDGEEGRGGYSSGGYHKSRSLPLNSLLSILSDKKGEKVEQGNIRSSLYGLFGDDASPTVRVFVDLLGKHGGKLMQQFKDGDTGALMGTLGQIAMGFMKEQMSGGHGSSEGGDYGRPSGTTSSGSGAPLAQAFAGKKRQEALGQGSVFEGMDNAVLISGCQSNETSADVNPNPRDPNSAHGALTFTLMKVMKESGPEISYKELVMRTRDDLARNKFTQHPCLYGGDHMADKPFVSE